MTEDDRVRWHHHSMDMSLSKLRERQRGKERTGKPGVLQSMGSQGVRHDLAVEQHPQVAGLGKT